MVTRWTDWGKTVPGPTTTGLRADGVRLDNFNDPANTSDVIVKDGQEITGKTIWGRIKFAGAGRVADCIVKGPKLMPSGQTGMIDVTNKRGGLAIIEDNLFSAQTPNHRMDAVVGQQFRAYRNRMRGVVDGFGTFTTKATTSKIVTGGWVVDAEFGGNWVEQHIYFFPDDNHTDGPHTDGWQHQGGLIAAALGNRFSGYAVKLPGSGNNPDKPWLLTAPNRWTNGAGTIIQDNVGGGLDKTVRAVGNFYEGYLAHANLKNGGPYEFSGNNHSDDVAVGPSSGMTGSRLNGYWIRLQSRASTKVIGLNTNKWWKGSKVGQVLTETRAFGINFDS